MTGGKISTRKRKPAQTELEKIPKGMWIIEKKIVKKLRPLWPDGGRVS